MNFSQLQERVRLELLRRIERGTLSVSLLARQTGLGQPHISNFLHNRRGLSLKALDKILEVQRLQVVDLLPARRESNEKTKEETGAMVQIPLVSEAVAAFEWHIRPTSTLALLPFPVDTVQGLEARCSNARRQWDRFIAVRIAADDAREMEPVLEANAVVVLDRHYTSFHAYREGTANLYGARVGSRMLVRYAQFQGERVVLRAYQARVKAEVLEPDPGEMANDLLVGRVVVVVNPH
jgi:transcriptional regulator with XRE-family HTH domain